MSDSSGQDRHWSRYADRYEAEFIDPFLKDVKGNPLKPTLRRLARRGAKVAADLGCGVGPLLPFLSKTFASVWAVDFAEGMLKRSRHSAKGSSNIRYLRTSLTDLSGIAESLDVAVAVNSLVMPDVSEQQRTLNAVFKALRPGGFFVGILPAMDAVHYHTMLLVERALAAGRPIDQARKSAAHLGDHSTYDFAFGQFSFDGLEQHFWQPFEARFRFEQAGFRLRKLKKLHLSWSQFSGAKDLKKFPAPWDWFFAAVKPGTA